MKRAGVLQCFVVAQETADAHVCRTIGIDYLYVEIAHHEVREVVTRHLEEQLVLVDGIRMIGYDIEELLVTLGRQFAGSNGVAVAQHYGAPAPYIAQVELSAMQATSLLHAVDNHTCHLSQLALREILHKHLHIGKTAIAVAVVEFRQTIDEHKLIAVLSHGESLFRQSRVAAHLSIAIGLESLVSGAIQRILHVFSELGVLLEVWIREQRRPRTLRILALQACHIVGSQIVFVATRMEQEHVVVDIGHLFKLREVGHESCELLFAERQIVELVLEDDARIVESILNDQVACGHLLFGKWYLCQIVFTLVRVVLCAVVDLFERVLKGLLLGNGVQCLLRKFFAGSAHSCYDSLVGALPVIDILTLAPLLFESLLTLLHGQRIVEVPLALLL